MRTAALVLGLALLGGACSSGGGHGPNVDAAAQAPTTESTAQSTAQSTMATGPSASTTGGPATTAPPAGAKPAASTKAGPATTTTAKPATTTSTTAAATPTTSSTAAPAPSSAAITIQNFAFSPAALNVAVGTKVTATNLDGPTHTWTADDGSWDSGNLATNAKYSHTFTQPGTYTYHCAIHTSMRATVTVH